MSTVYLIPSLLHEEGTNAIPVYVLDAIKDCSVFFVENERTTRRYFKQLWKTYLPGSAIVIDDHEWVLIDEKAGSIFRQKIKEGKNIGIVSEAGCPGVADPGQVLVTIAQQMGARVKPLVGPSSILLALMASGMNGQQFSFAGYLPIDITERANAIKEQEQLSARYKSTQIFIETPYRNNQLLETMLKTCQDKTRICVAVNLTGRTESIRTMTVAQWKSQVPDLHKKPAIFLLYAEP
ncbi:MAG: SAM-dependent methyltransferase [Chitinophagaceae bacterium]|nr:SAM-dependent methyltransferase [Chitinophagaceae bacterium]